MSEGELFIAQYLKAENIKYIYNHTINGLKNDSKSYRITDFYLPDYNVCIEFLGQWHVESERSRYKEKKSVYSNNNIPCVYIYPDNLGAIEYIFEYRMMKVMQDCKMRKELSKYKWKLYFRENINRSVFLFGGFVLVLINSALGANKLWFYLGLSTIVFQLYYLFKYYKFLFLQKRIIPATY
jgi:hypothetical protein